MTMPREIYVSVVKKEFMADKYICYSTHVHKDETPYYSQSVIDEKDARIKQLEDVLKQASKFIYRRTAPKTAKLIDEALAGKGGA